MLGETIGEGCMKFKDIERKLNDMGFFIIRAQKHYVFGHQSGQSVTVPRQKEINFYLVKAIIKQAAMRAAE